MHRDRMDVSSSQEIRSSQISHHNPPSFAGAQHESIMEPIWMFPLFMGRVLLLALVITGLDVGINGKAYLGSTTVEYLLACVASFWLLLLDTIYIYPRLRSPLRHLPIVPVSVELIVKYIY